MANSPITALVKQEERNPQVVGTSWINFSFASSLSSESYHTWRQWDYWSHFLVVTEKPITPFAEGISLQGGRCGISFPAAVRALLRSGLSWWPAESHHWARNWRSCAFAASCPIHPAWFCVLASNPAVDFIFAFFSDTSRKNTSFSGNHTLSHASFLENTNLSASASVILATIFLHKTLPALFFS